MKGCLNKMEKLVWESFQKLQISDIIIVSHQDGSFTEATVKKIVTSLIYYETSYGATCSVHFSNVFLPNGKIFDYCWM